MTGRRRPPERGAALLVAMVAIAVLTALAVDLAYESRVSLRIAANARDELRASYLARSGVSLSRLVLSFQQTLDDTPKAAGFPIPRLQLWKLVPVGSDLAGALFAGGEGGADPSVPATFDATVDDEGRKVNAQLETLGQGSGSAKAAMEVQALYQLVCDPRWDPLFEREDANGVRTSREDLLVRLRDWVDLDSDQEGLRATFGGTACALVAGQPPFEKAYGDENQPYDRGDDRYRAKNARMDSLAELFMVAGVGDAFMAAFGDALTVYLPRDGVGAKRNVNELDRGALVRNAFLIADPPLQPALLDPRFGDVLQQLVVQQTLGGLLSLTPEQFGELVRTAGVEINPNLVKEGPASAFTDRSTTFRIQSSGKAGDVTSRIDVVVRLEKAVQGQPMAAPGRVIHWQEE